MKNPRESIPQLQLVTFWVGGEEFGVDVLSVHEILRHQPVTAVPGAPAFVQGVIDVRGALVPIIDLRHRFGAPSAEVDGETRMVLVRFEEERLGLVVDAVTEVLRVPESAVSAPPRYFRGIASEYLRGIVRLEGRIVILIDMDLVLSSEERIALQASGEATSPD